MRPLGLTAGLSYCDTVTAGQKRRRCERGLRRPKPQPSNQASILLRYRLCSVKNLPSKAGISWIALGGCPGRDCYR